MVNTWYSKKIPVSEIYIRILKKSYKIWMSKLNDFPELNLGKNTYIVSMEGYNTRGDYEAKRIRLRPQEQNEADHRP